MSFWLSWLTAFCEWQMLGGSVLGQVVSCPNWLSAPKGCLSVWLRVCCSDRLYRNTQRTLCALPDPDLFIWISHQAQTMLFRHYSFVGHSAHYSSFTTTKQINVTVDMEDFLLLKSEHSVLRGLWDVTLENLGPDLPFLGKDSHDSWYYCLGDTILTARSNLMFKLVDMIGRDYTIVSPGNGHIVKGGIQMGWAWASGC